MRNLNFANGEFYHVYNRGVDKRDIFLCQKDLDRFLSALQVFNELQPIGSIYEASFLKEDKSKKAKSKLVNIICYCLNPNHYHLILEQVSDNGMEKFMHRLGTSYTKFFNIKYKRSGSLFENKFKAKHVSDNDYLLHLSAYVNLNYRVHQLGSSASKSKLSSLSSWPEYLGELKNGNKDSLCQTDIIADQFKTVGEYKSFAEEACRSIAEKKQLDRELEMLLMEEE